MHSYKGQRQHRQSWSLKHKHQQRPSKKAKKKKKTKKQKQKSKQNKNKNHDLLPHQPQYQFSLSHFSHSLIPPPQCLCRWLWRGYVISFSSLYHVVFIFYFLSYEECNILLSHFIFKDSNKDFAGLFYFIFYIISIIIIWDLKEWFLTFFPFSAWILDT